MEAIMSNKGLGPAGYVLVAFPAVLLLSIYLLAYAAMAGRFDATHSCRLHPHLEYAVPLG
jgi:hypothetical protein